MKLDISIDLDGEDLAAINAKIGKRGPVSLETAKGWAEMVLNTELEDLRNEREEILPNCRCWIPILTSNPSLVWPFNIATAILDVPIQGSL